MRANLERALATTLVYEGGYVNHPADPGGATMKGVTQKVYDKYREKKGLSRKDVRYIDEVELHAIYRFQYWDLVAGDSLPSGVDMAVFDYAVNSGATRASRALQQVCGVRVDGNIGLSTITAANELGPQEVINRLCDERLAFVRRLNTFSTFGKGWTRRIEAVRKAALDMTVGQMAFFAEQPEADEGDAAAPADPRDIAFTSTNTGRGVATTSFGVMGTAVSEAADRIQSVSPYSSVIMAVSVFLLLIGVGLSMYGMYRAIREERAV